MEYAIIEKKEDNRFDYKDSNSIELSILSLFFVCDLRYEDSTSFYKEWCYDNRYWGSGGNITDLVKENGNIVISDTYSEEPDRGPFLTMSKENFVELLDKWETACKQKPNEIIITKENGKVLMAFK